MGLNLKGLVKDIVNISVGGAKSIVGQKSEYTPSSGYGKFLSNNKGLAEKVLLPIFAPQAKSTVSQTVNSTVQASVGAENLKKTAMDLFKGLPTILQNSTGNTGISGTGLSSKLGSAVDKILGGGAIGIQYKDPQGTGFNFNTSTGESKTIMSWYNNLPAWGKVLIWVSPVAVYFGLKYLKVIK